MATLGSLVVSLEANMAQFNDNMNRASSTAQQAMSLIESASARAAESVKLMGMAAVGIAAGVSFQAMIDQFDKAVESAAGLKDMAEKTGASVEALSGLSAVAKAVGQDMGGVEVALTKLAKNLSGTDDEAKGTAHALDTIGLKMKDLRQMDTAEAFKTVADKLADFKDGIGKTAIAQDILGKSGAQLLPYMKDLAESGDLVAKTTAEQAAQADEYQKNLVKLTAAKNALYKTVTMEVLPAVNDFLTVMIDAKREASGAQQVIRGLAADGSIQEWAQNAAKAAALVMDSFDGVVRTVQVLGRSLAGIWKDIETASVVGITALGAGFTEEGQRKISQAIADRQRFIETMNEDMDRILMKSSFSDRLNSTFEERKTKPQRYSDQAATVMAAYKGYSLDVQRAAMQSLSESYYEGSVDKPSLNGYRSNLGKTKAAKEEADDYARLMKMVQEKIAVQQTELSNQFKLTDAAKEYAKFLVDVQEGHVKLTGPELEKLKVQWDAFLKNADALQARARQLAYETARLSILDIGASFNRDTQARLDSMAILPALMREQETALRGVDEKAREAEKNLRRLFADGKIDAEQYTAVMQELNDVITAQKNAVEVAFDMQERLNGSWEYGARRSLQDYADTAQNVASQAQDAMKRAFTGMEDALVNFTKTGKFSFTSLADSIITDLIRIQIRQQMAGMVSNSGGLLSVVSGFLGNTSGGASAGDTGMGVAQGLKLPSYDVGTDYVPKDMVAMIHQGEMIVPKAFNPNAGGSAGGTGKVVVNVVESPGNGGQVQQSQGPGGVDVITVLVERVKGAVASDIAKSGNIAKLMEQRYGLSPAMGAVR